MAINFSNNRTLGEVSNRISVPGRIVQTVHTVHTTAMQTSSLNPVDWFTSAPITLINANNIVLIEHQSDNRTADWGDGQWNLYYIDIVHVQTNTQITYAGYIGEYTHNIRHAHRVGRHIPGTVGPHTYKVRGWCYQAKVTNFGNPANADGDGRSYLRITEIAV